MNLRQKYLILQTNLAFIVELTVPNHSLTLNFVDFDKHATLAKNF